MPKRNYRPWGWVGCGKRKEVGVGGGPFHLCMDNMPSHYMFQLLVVIPFTCQYKILGCLIYWYSSWLWPFEVVDED
jgi:hypothetical protein